MGDRVGFAVRDGGDVAATSRRRRSHFWGARTFGWGDSIPDALMDKTYDYHDLARLASAVRGWTAVRRRRLGERATLVPKKDERLLRGPAPPRKNLRRHPINKSN